MCLFNIISYRAVALFLLSDPLLHYFREGNDLDPFFFYFGDHLFKGLNGRGMGVADSNRLSRRKGELDQLLQLPFDILSVC
jgi:hypothetical protein